MSEHQYYGNEQQMYPYFYYPASSPAYYPATYHYRQFSQPQAQTGQPAANQTGVDIPGMLPPQQSYIENILRLNRGKLATAYMSFNGTQKTFKGVIEAAGRDHIILSDPETKKRYLLLMVYLDYVTFNEPLNYSYPYNNQGQMASYPSR
ncbi:spore coat protein GerQ [Cerasibacillus terrae]|uniref:Spore coat protein GerQ n=1 Tax=Cerasibacillus terrae TaxID=2498845 RepID=A0A5C8NZ98_9BACI|nr:spore coat protein GerQ [Cerasibacillus terrae]TXL66594.1 spore coat protein GerQ [Cerasibacillus terrae]